MLAGGCGEADVRLACICATFGAFGVGGAACTNLGNKRETGGRLVRDWRELGGKLAGGSQKAGRNLAGNWREAAGDWREAGGRLAERWREAGGGWREVRGCCGGSAGRLARG